MYSPSHQKHTRSRFWVAIVVSICLGTIAFSTMMVLSRRHIWRPTNFPGADDRGTRTNTPFGQNGFDLSRATIPSTEVYRGGPPKDGIPALTDPRMVLADDAAYLGETDRVIGVTLGGEARAYPIKILNYHEVVNDSIGGQPVAITYCPLCDSAAAFDRRAGSQIREFGVSGLLYNSNVLMFDRKAIVESLWSQMMTASVSGPSARQNLKTIPLELTTWSDWRRRNPTTIIMSINTGHDRDYRRSPYELYFASLQELVFPVDKTSDRLPMKAPVLGVWTDDTARAFPLSAFDEKNTTLEDELNGRVISLVYNPKARSLRIEHADDGVQWVYSLWFAWYAFHPDTDVGGKMPVSK
ncbi:MAG: DUF3179 domain-containing protein [Pirellulaceae bacterium]|jgi:hypothetical protein|nr:DUF3179 domain-containing protein [Pirellulaceae bacterium]MDP6720427.1 DUF3179 domain-containing protein [Pirellulaceae bacterium]